MSTLELIGGGRRPASDPVTTEYHEFRPPRRPEEYIGQAGPHAGLALPHAVIEAIGRSRITGKAHEYLVRGELRRSDGVRFLDIAIDRQWVIENSNHRLIEGMLRYQCPGCGKLSGAHQKGCDWR